MNRKNPIPTAPAQGLTMGPRISSRYLMPVRVPLPSLQMCVRPSIDMPPQTTTKPVVLNNVRSSMTLLQSRSCLSHVLSVKLLTCVKSTGCQWWRCHFWYMAKANPAPRCWAVSTRPSRGMCDPQAS